MPFTIQNMLNESAMILSTYCSFWRGLCRNRLHVSEVKALILQIQTDSITPSKLITSLTTITEGGAGDDLTRFVHSVRTTMTRRLTAREDNVLINTLRYRYTDLPNLFETMPQVLTPDEYKDALSYFYGHLFLDTFSKEPNRNFFIETLFVYLNKESDTSKTEILAKTDPFQILIKFPHNQYLITNLFSSIIHLNTAQKLSVAGVNLDSYYERFIVPVSSATGNNFDQCIQWIKSIEKQQQGQIFKQTANETNLLTEIINHAPVNLSKILSIINELPEENKQSLSTQTTSFNNHFLLTHLMKEEKEEQFSDLLTFMIKNLNFEQIQFIYRIGLEHAIAQKKRLFFHIMVEKLVCFNSEQVFRILSEGREGTNSLFHHVLALTDHLSEFLSEVRFFIKQLHSLDNQHKIQLIGLTDLNGNNAIGFTVMNEPDHIAEVLEDMLELLDSITDKAEKAAIIAHLNKQNKNALMLAPTQCRYYGLELLINRLTTFNLSEEQLSGIIGHVDDSKKSTLIIGLLAQDPFVSVVLKTIIKFKNEDLKARILGQIDDQDNNALYYALQSQYWNPYNLLLLQSIFSLNDASAISIMDHVNSNGKNGFDMILTMGKAEYYRVEDKNVHLILLRTLFSRFKTSQILKWLRISKDPAAEIKAQERITPYLVQPLLEWATHLAPGPRYNMLRLLENHGFSSAENSAIMAEKNSLIKALLMKTSPVIPWCSSSLFQPPLNSKKEQIIRSYFEMLTGEKNLSITKSNFDKIRVNFEALSLINVSAVTQAILTANLQNIYFESKSGSDNKVQLSITNIDIKELLEKHQLLITSSQEGSTSQHVYN